MTDLNMWEILKAGGFDASDLFAALRSGIEVGEIDVSDVEGGQIVEPGLSGKPIKGTHVRIGTMVKPGRYLVYGPLSDSRDAGEKP